MGLLKYDQLTHAYGFATATWLCWQGLQGAVAPDDPTRPGTPRLRPSLVTMSLVATAGMGLGALNEVVEFVATRITDTNVGGYENTGWDLIANTVGATFAVCLIAWRGRDGSGSTSTAGWRLGTARLAISDATAKTMVARRDPMRPTSRPATGWKASDPNQDELRYRLEVRPEGRSDAWLEIADEIDGEQYGFDATVLPDGRYRFRLTASDALGNVAGEGLERRQESEPVVVDHTPPTLEGVERSGQGARLRVYDAWSPLREAQVSIDGGEWRPLAPADGLLDGQREELVLKEIPEGARYVLVRLADAPFNYATFDLLAELGSR